MIDLNNLLNFHCNGIYDNTKSLTETEIIMKLIEKLNLVILNFNDLENKTLNNVKKLDKQVNYYLDTGIKLEVDKQLDNTNGKIENINSQLDNIVNNSIKVINVREHNFDNTGVMDNSNLFNELLEKYKNYDTICLYFENGNYILNNISVSDKNVILKGENENLTKIFSNQDNPILTFNTRFVNISNVSSIERVKSTTKLIVDNTTGYAVGDLVRVVSEDIEVSSPSYYSKSRCGDFFTIQEVGNNYVIITGILPSNFINSVRIGKVGEYQLQTENISFGSLYNGLSQLTPLLRVVGGKYHTINAKILYTEQVGIEFKSCYGYKCNVKSSHQANVPANEGINGKLGYSVCDRGSSNFNIDLDCQMVRHPFTDGGNGDKETGLEHYGISTNGCVSVSTNGRCQASIDTHRFAKKLFFKNCRAVNNGLVGINLRNQETIIENCYIDTYIGLQINGEELDKVSHIIKNSDIISEKECYIKGNNNNTSVLLQNVNLSYNNNFIIQNSEVTFENCNINTKALMEVENSNIIFKKCTITLNDINSIIKNTNSSVYLYDVIIILKGSNSYNNRIMSVASNSFKLYINKISFKNERELSKLTGISITASDTSSVTGDFTIKNIDIDKSDNRIQLLSFNTEFEKWVNGKTADNCPNITFTNSYN